MWPTCQEKFSCGPGWQEYTIMKFLSEGQMDRKDLSLVHKALRWLELGGYLGRCSIIIFNSIQVWNVSFISYDWMGTNSRADIISKLRILFLPALNGNAVCIITTTHTLSRQVTQVSLIPRFWAMNRQWGTWIQRVNYIPSSNTSTNYTKTCGIPVSSRTLDKSEETVTCEPASAILFLCFFPIACFSNSDFPAVNSLLHTVQYALSTALPSANHPWNSLKCNQSLRNLLKQDGIFTYLWTYHEVCKCLI